MDLQVIHAAAPDARLSAGQRSVRPPTNDSSGGAFEKLARA
jgi:hypothetical protein